MLSARERKNGLTFDKTKEVVDMTILEVLALLNLITNIVLGILGLTSGNKKK